MIHQSATHLQRVTAAVGAFGLVPDQVGLTTQPAHTLGAGLQAATASNCKTAGISDRNCR